MGKVFIVLDEQEQLALEMILVDRDEKEALKFLKNQVAPNLNVVIKNATYNSSASTACFRNLFTLFVVEGGVW